MYHFHYGGNDVVLREQDQVKSLYRMWAETHPINRYTLSSRNKFVTNPDGSVDLYLEADSPGKAKEANWLPAPKAKFVPMLRLSLKRRAVGAARLTLDKPAFDS